MNDTRSFSDKFFLVLKGLCMGAANKVPGVSGGIVAFVGGFYEEFIYSLQKINGKAFKLLLYGRFKSFYHYTNASFLALLIFGMLVSYFSVSKLLDYFLAQKELFVWAAFFGMILGSIYYIGKGFEHWNKKTILAGIAGLIVGISISFLSPAKENDNLLFIFLCGMISVSGMTLPGLSGSFILILLGNYVLLLVDSVNALYDTFAEVIHGDFSFIENSERLNTLKILAVFTTGSAVGLVTLSHILSYVLKHYKHITTAVILGFITGSLGVVWPWKKTVYTTSTAGEHILDSNGRKIIANYKRFFPDFGSDETWWAIFFVIAGISVLLGLDWYGKNRKEKS
ncbi:Integral membrane protein [hydrothermal vent metagenome]|uniref:Integral membrane protein n=1 Tax=hydrothermal vent metagenome TaxID=652676 RepID=A0A3B0SY39_9ZZZZ